MVFSVMLFPSVSFRTNSRIFVSLLASGVAYPRLVKKSCPNTLHSESSALVPADSVKSVFPMDIAAFRISVWSFVAAVTPATSHPSPGSPSSFPITSMKDEVKFSSHDPSINLASARPSLPL